MEAIPSVPSKPDERRGCKSSFNGLNPCSYDDCSRSAHVPAFPLLNTPILSSRRVMQRLVLLLSRVPTSLCYPKVPDKHRKENGNNRSSLLHHPLTSPRYANVDYVVGRSTNHNDEPKLIASYDIMCQWAKNLRKRFNEFPVTGSSGLDDRIVARVVPKFHLAAHRSECRANFSLNFEPGAARKDMEGPEQTWFSLQGGGSTKDQGPGFWSDTMDDKFSHWNWTKLVSLGKAACLPRVLSLTCVHTGPLFKKKYLNAVAQAKVHEDELAFLNRTLPDDVRDTWTTMIKEWERDRTKPNPYYTPLEGMRILPTAC